jgi:hypothetical protein
MIVNENASLVRATLRASGNVDGHMRVEGRGRSFHSDGVLFYLAPRYLRFDLKTLGQRQALFGSNPGQFWVCNQEETCQCGSHGSSDEMDAQMPVRPAEIIEALGLAGMADGAGLDSPSHSVVGEYQKIVLASSGRLQKEYWLDRAAPRLIRRIVFRDSAGAVRMQSSLDDYRPLASGGPWLPHSMTADWPTTGARLRFRIAKWTLASEVGPGGPQFTPPAECRELTTSNRGRPGPTPLSLQARSEVLPDNFSQAGEHPMCSR